MESNSQGGKWLTHVHLVEWPLNWYVCAHTREDRTLLFVLNKYFKLSSKTGAQPMVSIFQV